MDKVNIFVIAEPNKGKTTIASIIKQALEDEGFKRVVLKDIPVSSEAKQPIEQRIMAAQERLVEIVVMPASAMIQLKLE